MKTSESFYILTTRLPNCLNRLVESGEFHALRKHQADSGPFIQEMLTNSEEDRATARFLFFDRVRGSKTSWTLSTVYDFVDLRLDKKAALKQGAGAYRLVLKKVHDIAPAIPFRQGTPLWEKLETTRGKKTTTFYCGGRMLLPIPREDFEAALKFSQQGRSRCD